ncbi:Thioredoxin 7 domain containing protein [Trichuris trichiura]|uniref:Thioredoxin 7 domain containing protein n=1 Tax=Trichuris trichiura TaxID=36087 RepID=A0A077Z7R2_TRITR|nr:Thioredoxin 7 domain containing protein [Trichuris trichiura]
MELLRRQCYTNKPNWCTVAGWGDDIAWVSFEDVAKFFRKRPMFLLIHKSWCPACQALKPKFTKAKQIVELSKYFVMVNAQDDEEPWEEVYKPDGAYIPRILFLGILKFSTAALFD